MIDERNQSTVRRIFRMSDGAREYPGMTIADRLLAPPFNPNYALSHEYPT